MFGANKTLDILKLDNTTQTFTSIKTIKARYEPKKFNSFKEQEKKENHITYRLFCDLVDIKVGDKIKHILSPNNRLFSVGGVFEFSDTYGGHLEVLMREENTNLHNQVIKKSLNAIQSNYDELLGERNGDKNYTEETLNVLLDSAKLMKQDFIKMLSGGKMENLEWVMTLDFPKKVAKEDKIVYNEITYEIKWIIPFPDKTLVGLYTLIDNYE